MTTTTTDQKKRSLEAIERRFAAAEAELRLQQQLNDSKVPLKKGQVDVLLDTSVDCSSSASVYARPPSKKGNVSFAGHRDSRGVEENDPTYLQLLHPVHENLLTDNVKMPDGRAGVNKVLHELLQGGDSAQKYLNGSRSMKIDNWILLDNIVQGRGWSTSARLKALQKHSKRSKKRMPMSQFKICGALKHSNEPHNYEFYKPMHALWKDYIKQLLKNVGKNQLAQCLLDADLHGAIILVAHCKMSFLTGTHGIMIRETAETLGIITEDDKLRVVPKKISVFMLQVDCWKVTLHGDKLSARNMFS